MFKLVIAAVILVFCAIFFFKLKNKLMSNAYKKGEEKRKIRGKKWQLTIKYLIVGQWIQTLKYY